MGGNLEKLITEQRNENTMEIDGLDTKGILSKINKEDEKIAERISKEIDKISLVVDECVKRMREGGRLIYCGAGTSGRLGILDAVECRPTYGIEDGVVIGLLAGGENAMFRAKEGAEDNLLLCVNDLKNIKFSEKDVLIGLAASGRTPYVIGGLDYAKTIGAFTASIACNNNSEISKIAKVGIEVVVGPEVVTGSTRMKAGTATKMILNMISTAVMIKLGKVYSNLMVDVRATNEKLVERAKRIVIECTGVHLEECEKALELTNFNVKEAIVHIKTGKKIDEVRSALDKHNGIISKAIEEI